jgi:hypothetical protein
MTKYVWFLVNGLKALLRNHSHTLDFHHQIRMSEPLYSDQRARRQLLFEILIALVSTTVVFIDIYGERRGLNHVGVIAAYGTQRAPDIFARRLTVIRGKTTMMRRLTCIKQLYTEWVARLF